jgi:hypothetical protein
MAGILLAGEIVRELSFPDNVLNSYYFNTLLGNFMRKLVPNRKQPKSDWITYPSVNRT